MSKTVPKSKASLPTASHHSLQSDSSIASLPAVSSNASLTPCSQAAAMHRCIPSLQAAAPLLGPAAVAACRREGGRGGRWAADREEPTGSACPGPSCSSSSSWRSFKALPIHLSLSQLKQQLLAVDGEPKAQRNTQTCESCKKCNWLQGQRDFWDFRCPLWACSTRRLGWRCRGSEQTAYPSGGQLCTIFRINPAIATISSWDYLSWQQHKILQQHLTQKTYFTQFHGCNIILDWQLLSSQTI